MQVSLAGKSSELRHAWRVLGSEQRVAAVGSLLLIVSTFGPFSWVEVAEILIAVGVLFLLKRRAAVTPTNEAGAEKPAPAVVSNRKSA